MCTLNITLTGIMKSIFEAVYVRLHMPITDLQTEIFCRLQIREHHSVCSAAQAVIMTFSDWQKQWTQRKNNEHQGNVKLCSGQNGKIRQFHFSVEGCWTDTKMYHLSSTGNDAVIYWIHFMSLMCP